MQFVDGSDVHGGRATKRIPFGEPHDAESFRAGRGGALVSVDEDTEAQLLHRLHGH